MSGEHLKAEEIDRFLEEIQLPPVKESQNGQIAKLNKWVCK